MTANIGWIKVFLFLLTFSAISFFFIQSLVTYFKFNVLIDNGKHQQTQIDNKATINSYLESAKSDKVFDDSEKLSSSALSALR